MAVVTLGGWVGQAVVEELLKTVASYLEGQIKCESNIKSALKKLEVVLTPIKVALEKAEKIELNSDENQELGKWIWQLRDAIEEAEDVLDEMEYYRLERQISKRNAERRMFSRVCSPSNISLEKFLKFGKNPTLEKLNAAIENLEQVSAKINILNDIINISPLCGGGNNSSDTKSRGSGYALTVDVVGREKSKNCRMKYEGLPIKSDFLPPGCLNKDDSLSLFYKHAFDGKDPDEFPYLKSVGEEIVNKCGGLPLTLKVIGGLLNTNLDISYWLLFLEKSTRNLEENMYYDVKEVLKLSYQCLPSNLRSCFRICSLFPHGYKFEKDEIITLWMGLGCISQSRDEDRQPDDIGQNYLDTLVMRSFFICEDEYWGEKVYSVHNLLHDLARDVSKGECLRVEVKKGNEPAILPKTLRHLFVNQLTSNLVGEIAKLKRLRTLAIDYYRVRDFGHDDHDISGKLNNILNQLRSLHALFINNGTMPNLSAIRQLKYLRFFRMEVDILNKPLEPLYKLYLLNNLVCAELHVERTPQHLPIKLDGIDKLVKLRQFVLPERIFCNITQLRHLTELQKVNLYLNEYGRSKLSDLTDLNKLHHLVITNNGGITSFEEAEKANLAEKKNLETLSLKWVECHPPHHQEIYDCLQPMKNSKIMSLNVENYSGIRAPRWMTSDYLPCVTHLKLDNCKNLKYLPPLGQLPALKVLTLERIDGLKQLGIEFFGVDGNGGFSSLQELRISSMDNWEEWTRVENTSLFPCLTELFIFCCRKLKQLPSLPLSLKKLHLGSVGVVALPQWQDVDGREVGTSHNSTPALEILELDNCPELNNFKQFLSKCFHLTKLSIKRCESLRELPDLPLRLKNLKLGYVGLIALPAWQDVHEVKPSLEDLQISHCERLVNVQPFIRKCAFLKGLKIVECPKVMSSDESNLNRVTSSTCLDLIDGVTSLKTLTLQGLPNIKTLDCAKSLLLQVLVIERCESLISLDGLQGLTSLSVVFIAKCKNLTVSSSSLTASSSSTAQESFAHAHSPLHLEIDNILLLQIESLRRKKSVKKLEVRGDQDATCLPQQWLLQNNTSLMTLVISGCTRLKSLPDDLPISLTTLDIKDCRALESLPNKMPSSLESLEICSCPMLKSLPNKMPSSLKSLRVSLCYQLESLSDEMPSSLITLYICNLPLQSLPDNMPSSLKSMRIMDCLPFESLPNMMSSSLEKLEIIDCPLVKSLPDEMPSSLESLYICYCPLLKSLPNEMPSSLRSLEIMQCHSLESLPNKMLASLDSLEIKCCALLSERYNGPDRRKIAHIPHTDIC